MKIRTKPDYSVGVVEVFGLHKGREFLLGTWRCDGEYWDEYGSDFGYTEKDIVGAISPQVKAMACKPGPPYDHSDFEHNPNRPPKQWMRDCVKGASKNADDPGAVCGALWYHKMSPAQKRAALAKEGKLMANPYRVNFGNGQVSGTVSTIKEVLDIYDRQHDFDLRHKQSSGDMKVEKYMGHGEWAPVHGVKEWRDYAHGRGRYSTNPTVKYPDGTFRHVKNLGWLLRNWQKVHWFEVKSSNATIGNTDRGTLLIAHLREGGKYISSFADKTVLASWLNRPVFQGARVLWFGREETIGPAFARKYGERRNYDRNPSDIALGTEASPMMPLVIMGGLLASLILLGVSGRSKSKSTSSSGGSPTGGGGGAPCVLDVEKLNKWAASHGYLLLPAGSVQPPAWNDLYATWKLQLDAAPDGTLIVVVTNDGRFWRYPNNQPVQAPDLRTSYCSY